MKFKAAIEATRGLEQAFRPGLQALQNSDRNRITAIDARKLAGSANIDEALRAACPNEPRWDYSIGLKRAGNQPEKVFWLEVHPATEGQIKTVLTKLSWLKSWLAAVNSPLVQLDREYIWIASGKTSFTAQSAQAKQLAIHGIQCVGRHFAIG